MNNNSGLSFGSAEDPSDGAARRLQDLHYRPGASRQVLSRGGGSHATYRVICPSYEYIHQGYLVPGAAGTCEAIVDTFCSM